MLVSFQPAISNKSYITQKAQTPAFNGFDMGVRTVEDFFQRRPSIQTFLTSLDRTPENDVLVAGIRKKAAEMEKWNTTGPIDHLWFKRPIVNE